MPTPPGHKGPYSVGVAAAFTKDPAPWIEPPSFAPAGGVVGFTLATKTEIALAAETALADGTARADEPALAVNPTVLFALFGEPTLALAGDPAVLYALFSEPTLTLTLRYVDDVRTRDQFC